MRKKYYGIMSDSNGNFSFPVNLITGRDAIYARDLQGNGILRPREQAPMTNPCAEIYLPERELSNNMAVFEGMKNDEESEAPCSAEEDLWKAYAPNPFDDEETRNVYKQRFEDNLVVKAFAEYNNLREMQEVSGWKRVEKLPFSEVATAQLIVERGPRHTGLLTERDIEILSNKNEIDVTKETVENLFEIYPEYFQDPETKIGIKIELSQFFPPIVSADTLSLLAAIHEKQLFLIFNLLNTYTIRDSQVTADIRSSATSLNLLHRDQLLQMGDMLYRLGLYSLVTTAPEMVDVGFKEFLELSLEPGTLLCQTSLFEVSMPMRVYQASKRYFSLLKLSPTKIDLLTKLYKGNLLAISRSKTSPLEKYIVECTRENYMTLSLEIGMNIPAIAAGDSYLYYLMNVVDYKNVLEGSEPADNEIFTRLGIYFYYTSRSNLYYAYQHLICKNERVFAPMRCNITGESIHGVLNRSLNTDLTTGETVNEALKNGEFVICFGKYNAFHTTTLEELDNAFQITDENTAFRIPYDYGNEYEEEIVDNLVSFLALYPDTPQKVSLLDKIKKIKEISVEKNNAEKQRLVRLKQAPEEVKLLIKEYYYKVFDLGMYFRKWRGPGHPYPMDKASTEIKDFDPNNVTTKLHLDSMGEITKNLPREWQFWIRETPLFDSSKSGRFKESNSTLGRLHDNVLRDEACIRMASSEYIATSVRALLVYFRTSVPNFDVRSVVHIT